MQVAVRLGIGDAKEGQDAVIAEIAPKSATKATQKVPWGRSRY